MQDSRTDVTATTTISRGGRRFDVGPLLRWAECVLVDPFTASRYDAEPSGFERTHVTAEQIAGLLGVSMRTVKRWRSSGSLGEYQADVLACRIGLHPSLLWPQWSHTRAPCGPQDVAVTVT